MCREECCQQRGKEGFVLFGGDVGEQSLVGAADGCLPLRQKLRADLGWWAQNGQ
jgi:hypothetical protein